RPSSKPVLVTHVWQVAHRRYYLSVNRHVTASLSNRARSLPAGIAATLMSTALLTSILAPFQDHVGLLNEGLLFLLLTLLISSMWGWQVGLAAAVTTNLTLNFFFVEPLHR